MKPEKLVVALVMAFTALPGYADEVPMPFQGTWSSSQTTCEEDMPNGVVVLEVTPDSLGFYEIGCGLSALKDQGNIVTLRGSCSKGGMEKDETGRMRLKRLGPDTLTLSYSGYKFMADADDTYFRCKTRPSSATTTTTTTLHNGSVVSLESRGNQRTISYVSPRSGMVAAGAKSGDVLFSGVIDGDHWHGMAAIFNQRCGRREFAVAGTQSSSDEGIALSGKAPRLSDKCQTIKTVQEYLVFTKSDAPRPSK